MFWQENLKNRSDIEKEIQNNGFVFLFLFRYIECERRE